MSDPVNEIDHRIAQRIRELREARTGPWLILQKPPLFPRRCSARSNGKRRAPRQHCLAVLPEPLNHAVTAVGEAEGDRGKLIRRSSQQRWRDPETGFQRVALSPPAAQRLQLVEGELPPRARISYPASSYGFFTQQMWVLDGTLTFHEGKLTHVLEKGDCLELSEPADCTFENTSATRACRYLVAISMK